MLGIIGELLELLLFIVTYYVTEIVYFVCRSRPRKSFAGQSVLVTGGARGMGALYCWRFAEMGCTVHCVDVDEAATNALVGELTAAKYTAHGYVCDVRDWDKLTKLKENVEQNTPSGVDLLINNAGVYIGKSLLDLTPKQIAFTLDVNLLGQMYVTKQFLPGMKKRGLGHIVNIASIAGYLYATNGSDYSASKTGSVGFSECLQLELADSDIKVTFVCPWAVRTPLIEGIHIKVDKMFPMMEPERVVNEVILGAREDKERIFVPSHIQGMYVLKTSLPAKVFDAIGVITGSNECIKDDFKGRDWSK